MIVWDQPLYLYFLDRELGRLLAGPVDANTTERVLKTLLLGTTSTLYCGLSLLWESPGLNADLQPFISHLVRNGALDIISHHSSTGEFLESRRVLYAHDIQRYPMYFSESAGGNSLPNIEPTQFKDDSTTGALNERLVSWAVAQKRGFDHSADDAAALAVARKAVANVLVNRADQAITLSLFAPEVAHGIGWASAIRIIQRAISRLYVSHYVEFGNATIPTGIPRLEFFDTELATGFPNFDFPVISLVLATLGLGPLMKRPWREFERKWSGLSDWRHSYPNLQFRDALRLLLQALCQTVKKDNAVQGNYAVREAMLGTILHRSVSFREVIDPAWEDMLYRLNSLEENLRMDRAFTESMEIVKEQSRVGRAVILLITVADVERDAVLEAFMSELGHDASRSYGRLKTYYELGTLGGARIILVQSEMGSVSPGASQSTTASACEELHPNAVIGVGIAFGVDNETQRIGDVLVSRQLHAYEVQRVGTDEEGGIKIVPRGSLVDASPRLLDRFKSASTGWKDAKVRFGLMLSGEKLVDNTAFRDRLRDLQPEAIGGEMEAAGIYAAALEHNAEWIVVKGICDWADGKKRVRKVQRQRLAASNAASLVVRTIKLGGLSGTVSASR